jgi:intracellular septation protein
MTSAQRRRLTGRAKTLVEFGPLLVFLVAYFLGRRIAGLVSGVTGVEFSLAEGEEMFLAVGAFLPAFAIAFVYSVMKERRVAPMLAVTGIVVGVLGSLTLVLHDKTFFFMKPTIVYALFAATLAAGLATGRNFLKTLFDGAFHLPDAAWRTLTTRYVIFFAVLALANEFAWRFLTRGCDLSAACAGEAAWVNVKVFGFTIANLLFAAAQAPLIVKHAKQPETPAS